MQPHVYVGTLLDAYATEGKCFWQKRIIGSIVLSRSIHITSPTELKRKVTDTLNEKKDDCNEKNSTLWTPVFETHLEDRLKRILKTTIFL